MSIAPATPEAVNATIGLPLRESFTRLTGIEQTSYQEEFVQRFHRRADQVMVDSAICFEFVPEALRQLRRVGISMAVASTKRRTHIEAILKRERLDESFQSIIGGQDVQNQKPHPESLLAASKRLEVPPKNCIYVGDSIVDAEAAQRAGMQFAAVLTGVTRRAEFDPYPAATILDDVGQLPAWLEGRCKK